MYTFAQNGPQFHRVGAPDTQTLERLLNRLVRRIVRRLIRYRIAAGQGAGGRTLTLKKPFRPQCITVQD